MDFLEYTYFTFKHTYLKLYMLNLCIITFFCNSAKILHRRKYGACTKYIWLTYVRAVFSSSCDLLNNDVTARLQPLYHSSRLFDIMLECQVLSYTLKSKWISNRYDATVSCDTIPALKGTSLLSPRTRCISDSLSLIANDKRETVEDHPQRSGWLLMLKDRRYHRFSTSWRSK